MDIFLLIYLSIKIFKKAKENHLRPWYWVMRLVTLFISTELVIAMIILNYVGIDKIIYAVIPSLLLASVSAYFIFQQLNRKIANSPQDFEEELIEEDEIEKPNLDHFR